MRDGGAASAVVEHRLSPWAIVVVAVVVLVVLIGGLVALKLFVAERIPELASESLEAARELWAENGPASYDLDLMIEGRQPGVVHVEVRNGVVTAANRDGRPTPERTWDEWSIPGQFDTLDRELEMAADPQGTMNAPPGAKLWVRCEFDPKYGYIRRFHRFATGGGTEVSWRTTAFVPK